jgi:hypothetical protein
MDAKYPQSGDVVILDLEPEGAPPVFWVRTQARGSDTPVFEGDDAWVRARAAAEELAGSQRLIWVRHKDGRFERLHPRTSAEGVDDGAEARRGQ